MNGSVALRLFWKFLIIFGSLSAFGVTACSHPAEQALQGRWNGQRVENFDAEDVPAATGWARGTSLEFSGTRLRVTVPAEESRAGVYRLSSITDRTVVLDVLDSSGEQSELTLIVDDEQSIRWLLGEGRSLVLKRQP
jgi:hypothetical protein